MNPLIVRWGLGAAVLAASLCGSAAAQVQVQQAYLKASNPGANDEFGHVVAIDGDTLVVGVPREDSNATGVNGDQANNSMPDAGAAYVFVRNGTVWT